MAIKARDGILPSIWQTTVASDHFPGRPPARADVVIVGGGITGCTTALELARMGKKCVLVEAHTLGFGTTGGTTAHLNTILDHTYPEIEAAFGEKGSTLLATGLKAALDHVDRNVTELSIANAHSWADGQLFSENDEETRSLEKIFAATRRAGVAVDWADRLSIPRRYQKVMRIPRQAWIHPLRYIHALAQRAVELGVVVAENCRVMSVEKDGDLKVHTPLGDISATHVIYATHIPPGIDLLHFRCAPYRSYALAAQLQDDAYPDALVYDMKDPYHYYRTHMIDGEPSLIVGGEDHKTGHVESTGECFDRLEEHVRSHFKVKRITHRWSSQYYETTDGLPYIGKMPTGDENLLVATGFSGNGMTLGTLSGIILSDLVVKGDHELAHLFRPGRISPVAGFKEFVKENADVVAHMASKPFLAEKVKELDELRMNEGRLVAHEGDRIALYKDEHGGLHAVDPTCPHAKCTVKWNSAERSWDCPCHGSRFNVDGELITGPSKHDLRTLEIRGNKAGQKDRSN